MVEIDIPGKGRVEIKNLVLDLNGTIANDGAVPTTIKTRINRLSKKLKVFIVSADTRDNLKKVTQGIQAEKVTIPSHNSAKGKKDFLQRIGPEKTAALGNGINDQLLLREACLGIGIIGKEGAAMKSLLNADIVVSNGADGLDLLLHSLRIKATLRR